MGSRTETLIYLDIDGVLNVGVGDRGNTAPLLLNERNHKMAKGTKDLSLLAAEEREYVEKVISVANRNIGPSEPGSYLDYICTGKDEFSDVLLARLAEVIRAAGDKPFVCLASNWRKPKHRNKVKRLEERISKHFSSPFVFDGTTEVINEHGAADRLRCIGDHMQSFCADMRSSDVVRVLVLDDFFVTSLNGWLCGDIKMRSTTDVEAYLRGRGRMPGVHVKLLHCYTEWPVRDGLIVEVGAGLTRERVSEAIEFLKAPLVVACSADTAPTASKTAKYIRSAGQLPSLDSDNRWAQHQVPSADEGRMSARKGSFVSGILAAAIPSRQWSRAKTVPAILDNHSAATT